MKLPLLLLALSSLTTTAFGEIVPGELLVKLKPNTTVSGRKAFVQKLVTAAKEAALTDDLVHLKFSSNTLLESEKKRLMADPSVEFVQPNYRYRPTARPTDPSYYKQWSLNNNAQTISPASYTTNNPGTNGADLEAEEAWDILTDCSNTIVAVIDTGVNYTAEDLVNNMWDGTNCKSNTGSTLGGCVHGIDYVDGDKDPMDFNGHGTHVSGTIGAEANNGKGIAGLCWNAKIMAVRVLGLDGGTTADIAKGIQFARYNGAKVINMSLGGASEGYDAVLDQAMTDATNAGVFIVSAAGNDGKDVTTDNITPCALNGRGRLCVAAVDQKFEIADFSNFNSSLVQIAAPGTNILSSINGVEATVSTDDFSTGWTLGSSTWQSSPVGTCYIGAPIVIGYPSSMCQGDYYSGAYHASSFRDYQTLLKNYEFATFTYRLTALLDEYALFTIAQSATSSVNFDDANQIRQQFIDVWGRGTLTIPMIGCHNSDHCSVGVEFESTSSSSARGVALGSIEINGLTVTADAYDIYDGTSMATPHVTGSVALLRSLNPNFTLEQISDAVLSTGTTVSSLSGKVSSSKVLNTAETLRYISTPTGVSATQIQ